MKKIKQMNQASKSSIQKSNKINTNSKSKELIKINADINELANQTGRIGSLREKKKNPE